MTWTMPAETAPQERVWMAFPRVGNTLGDDAASADQARDTWAAVANAVAGFEPVTMVVDPSAIGEAKRRLSSDGVFDMGMLISLSCGVRECGTYGGCDVRGWCSDAGPGAGYVRVAPRVRARPDFR